MKRENPKNILIEEIDEEILERMPEWFKRLRNEYLRSKSDRIY
jgi:hypothetical protein